MYLMVQYFSVPVCFAKNTLPKIPLPIIVTKEYISNVVYDGLIL